MSPPLFNICNINHEALLMVFASKTYILLRNAISILNDVEADFVYFANEYKYCGAPSKLFNKFINDVLECIMIAQLNIEKCSVDIPIINKGITDLGRGKKDKAIDINVLNVIEAELQLTNAKVCLAACLEKYNRLVKHY